MHFRSTRDDAIMDRQCGQLSKNLQVFTSCE